MFRGDQHQRQGQGAQSNNVSATSKASRRRFLHVSRRRRRENKASTAAVSNAVESSTSSHLSDGDDDDIIMAGMNDFDNASSVATPEEAAVSIMIMALENLSPMGHSSVASGRSNSVPETPIRNNLSPQEDEDAYRFGIINNNPVVRRAYSSNDVSGKRSQTRVRFQSSKRAIDEEDSCTLSDSEANVVHKHHAAIKSAMKKRGNGVYTPERQQRRGREEKRVPFAPRTPKKGRRARRYAERDGDDSYSVCSDPTNDSMDDSYRRPKKSEDFLDTLLDMISFDISVDEDTLGQYTDDDTFQSKEESLGRRARKKEGRKPTYEFANCSNADRGKVKEEDFQSACNSLDLPDTGKQVLNDISSALSFKEDTTSWNMDGPTEAGKRVISGISSALSFGGENKEIKPSNSKRLESKSSKEKVSEAKKEETKQAFSYTCSMEDVFPGQAEESPKDESAEDDQAPSSIPVERIDSAQLTFVSDLTSLAHHVPQVDLTTTMIHVSKSFEDSKKILSGIKSPLGFSGAPASRATPSPESSTEDDEEQKLEIVYLEDTDKRNKKDQAQVSMSTFGDELVQASNPDEEVKQQPGSAEWGQDDSTVESITRIMAKGKMSMKKMSPNRTAKAKKKKCDPRAPLTEFLGSIQALVSCNGSEPHARKETDKNEGQDFLTSLSQSFSFWSKDTREVPTEAPVDELDKSTATPVARNTSIVEGVEPDRNLNAKSGEDLECSGGWEAMDRSFPKGVSPDPEEVKSSEDGASEASLKKEVTVTIHTLELSMSEDEKTSDFAEYKMRSFESLPDEDPEEGEDTGALTLEEGDFSSNPETRSDDEFVNFDKPFPSPPRSPQYKMPKRSPGKIVKSLQADVSQLSRKSQSWNPIRLKASTVTAPRSSFRQIFHKSMGPKDSPKKSPGKSPIKAFPVTRTPPKVVRSEMDSPLLEKAEAPEDSQDLVEDIIINETEENDLIHSPTWPSADLNTTAESWQSFENEVFAGSKIENPKFETPKSPVIKEEDEEEFKITYQNQSAKWLRIYRPASKTQVNSPDNVTMYGESNEEFKSFGRRSLLRALSGTTQGEF